MPLSWTLRDALGQFNVLVARKCQLELPDANVRPAARAADLTPLSPAGVGNPASLGEGDVRQSLRLLQQFMLSCIAPDEILDACNHLVGLAKQYEGVDHNKDAAAAAEGGKANAPSTTDKKETIDDKKDNTITFLILDTMVRLLSTVAGVDGSAAVQTKRNDLFRIDQRETASTGPAAAPSSLTATMQGPVVGPDTKPTAINKCAALVPFAFNYLTHFYTAAVRHAAARLLGVLSVMFLPNITALLVERMTAAKKDQAKREFASFQRCVSFLDFRVGHPLATKATIEYLTALLAEMKNVDRGVLRQEMCQSIDAIYAKILSPGDARREQEWADFVRSEKGMEDWNVLFERIYAQIGKWSTKSKHMVFCYETMAHMVVFCRNVSFFSNRKRFDIFGELIKSIKSEKGETRKDCMRILARNYLHHLPENFLGVDSSEFERQLKVLWPVLLPKKTKPVPDEIPLVTELLLESGKRNLSFFVAEMAVEILSTKNYYSRQKAIVMQALSAIAQDSPQLAREMANYHAQLGPLVCPYIEESATNPGVAGAASGGGAGGDGAASSSSGGKKEEVVEDKTILLLRAALRCFPWIRHPKMEHVQITAAAVIMLCKHDDREISGQVSASLSSFIQLDLNQFFLPTLHTLVDLLKLDRLIDQRPDQILKICNTISLMCNTLAEHIAKQAAQAGQGGAVSPPGGSSTSSAPELQHFQVTPGAWLSLREHVESVVLIRLCHYEGWVRSELLRMLKNFSRPCFKQFELTSSAPAAAGSPVHKDLVDIPYLIDYLLPESAAGPAAGAAAAASSAVILPTNEIFYKPLHDLLLHHYDSFHGIISYAFSFMHVDLEIIHRFLDQSRTYTAELVNEEWYLFFRNKMLFCALAVRPSNLVQDSLEGVAPKAGAAAGAAHVISIHDLALKFTSARSRIINYGARVHEVHTFYEVITTFLQVVPSNTGSMSASQLAAYNSAPESSGLWIVKNNVAKDLSQIRAGGPSRAEKAAGGASGVSPVANYVELAKHLRRPVTDHEAAQAAAAADPKAKKKPKIDVKGMYYFNEFTTHVLASVFNQVAAEDYHAEVNVLTKSLDDYVAQWMHMHEAGQMDTLRTLPVCTRLHSAQLVSRFLSFRSAIEVSMQNPQHMNKAECMRRKGFFFQLLTHLMPSTSEVATAMAVKLDKAEAENLRALESAVLVGLTQLLSLGAVQDQPLEGQILYFIERILVQQGRGVTLAPHLHVGVSNALNTFLKQNAKYVHEFVRMSVSESHAHLEPVEADVQRANAAAQSAAGGKGKRKGSVTLSKDERHLIHREAHPTFRPVSTCVARYYLRALATNWTEDLAFWTGAPHNFSLAAMLVVSLLAQSGSDPESRAIGLLLAAELEQQHVIEQRQGSDSSSKVKSSVRLYSHESPFMYMESTLSYSHSLAVQASYLPYILPMLNEAVTLFAFVSHAKKESLIRLLLPWIYEVTTLLLAAEEAHAQSPPGVAAAAVKHLIAEVMTALTDLTRLSFEASILNEAIKMMWVTLLSNEQINERLVRLFAQQIVDEYNSLVELSDSHKVQPVDVTRAPSTPARPSAASRPASISPATAAVPARVVRTQQQGGPSSATPTVKESDAVVTGVECIADAPEKPAVEEEKKEDDASAAASSATAVAGEQPVSLTVEKPSTDAQSPPVPSPVQEAEEPSSPPAAAAQAQTPSASPSTSSAEPMTTPKPMHAEDRSSSSRSLDAGGAARAQAAVPLFSPTSNPAGAHAPLPRVPATARGASKEKALRKLIVMNLMRSSVGQEIVGFMASQLRTYDDHMPLDPDAFLKFIESRPTAGIGAAEPLNTTERSCFELLSNAVFENGHALPVTAAERARWRPLEVDSDSDVFTPFYPLLLQNAFALFHRSPEGHEMLVHLALALGLYDSRDVPTGSADARRDALVAPDRLIPRLVKAFPELRHRWSRVALTWACNALDQDVRAVSFTLWSKLEDGAFFFGEQTQENLVRAVLQVFYALRRNDDTNLKSLVSTLITTTAYPYDKTGWTALVSSGWALLVLSSVPFFSLGLSLLQNMFKLPDIPAEEQRRWILSLGRFLCRDSGQEVDTAIVEVLFKGLVSTRTYQPTLLLLESMAEIYAGATLPADNKLVILLQLVNIMHRIMDVERLAEMWRRQTQTASDEAKQQASNPQQRFSFISVTESAPSSLNSMDAEAEKSLVRGVDDCVNLSLLLHSYSQTEPAQGKNLKKLSNVFKNVSLSLARMLPDASNESSSNEEGGAAGAQRSQSEAMANWNRQLLFKKMLGMVQTTGGAAAPSPAEFKEDMEDAASPLSNALSPRVAKEALDGVHLPTASGLASQFFLVFVRVFNSADNFGFVLSFFQRMLQHCPAEWKSSLLLMLGHFLLESQHAPDAKQFQLLAEITTQSYFNVSQQAQESKLAEQIAYLLVERIAGGPNANALVKHTDLFNFVRARQVRKLNTGAGSSSGGDVLITESGRFDPQAELSEALTRLEAHTLPILKQMLGNPRVISRPMDAESAAKARVAHVRTASSSASMSATPAEKRNMQLQQQRLSFATLNEYIASGGAGPVPQSRSSSNLAAAKEGASSSKAATVAASAVSSPEAPPASPPAPGAGSPSNPFAEKSSNPFAAEEGAPAAPSSSSASSAAPVAPAPAAPAAEASRPLTDEEAAPGAVPVPIPSKLPPSADDSDDEDAAVFAAATQRLSTSANKAPAAAAEADAEAEAGQGSHRRESSSANSPAVAASGDRHSDDEQ